MVDSIADLKNRLICVLDQMFSECETLYLVVLSVNVRDLLLQNSAPTEVEQLPVAKPAEVLKHLSCKKCSTAKAEKVLIAV